jgi:hypothetical protein
VDEKASVVGTANITVGGQGALHYQSGQLPSELGLTSEEVTLEYAWEEGHRAGPPRDEGFYETTTNQGRSTERYKNVSLRVEPEGGQPEILVYPEHGVPEIEGGGTGEQGVSVFESRYLTRIGIQEDGESTNDSDLIGFWYQPAGEWGTAYGYDQASAEGAFSLFLNNMTVTVQQDGETVWQNWTGYREEDTGPAASSYERHLLQIHVTNGTLTLAEEDSVSVYGSRLDVEASGTVTAQTATGQLEVSDAVFAFDDQPLRMEGEGNIRLRETPSSVDGGLSLSVAEESTFDVEGGQRLDPGSGGLGESAGWRLWLPSSLLVLLATGAVAHRTGYTHKALTRWRLSRYSKWMTRGRELANGGDYSGAAPCFRRATRAQPVKGVAWYHLTIALLEDDRPREVLDVIDEAREGEAVIDELDFLELEAAAAFQVGQAERCRSAVAQMATGSEAMARSLARDLALGDEVLGSELASRLSLGDDDREGLPGYV